MARERRFTVRFEDGEMESIEQFANKNHVLTSAAVRWLIAVGLAENCARLQDVRRTAEFL
jgi:hypothetical protein